jgi:hypothetical protein
MLFTFLKEDFRYEEVSREDKKNPDARTHPGIVYYIMNNEQCAENGSSDESAS